MTHDQSTPLEPPRPSASSEEFAVYRWSDPKTEFEYSYIATNADRTFLLALGNYTLGFDFEMLEDVEHLVSKEYAPTGESLHLNMTGAHDLIKKAFPDGAVFGYIHFDCDLRIKGMELSVCEQKLAGEEPEYLIYAPNDYVRWYRELDLRTPLTPAEHAMVEGFLSIFGPVARNFPQFAYGAAHSALSAQQGPKQPLAHPVTPSP